MTNEEAINELLQCYSLYSPFKTAKKTNEAISMAIEALGKDTNVHTNSALDHIHNVVAENEYKRGYKEGYEQGKKDAIPVEWVEAEIKYLRTLDFEFASLAAGQINAMLRKWREEQEGGR